MGDVDGWAARSHPLQPHWSPLKLSERPLEPRQQVQSRRPTAQRCTQALASGRRQSEWQNDR